MTGKHRAPRGYSWFRWWVLRPLGLAGWTLGRRDPEPPAGRS